MFETALAAWHAILHLSEMTGLTVGALAALAALVWLDPRLLKPALIAAGVVAAVYAGEVNGYRLGYPDGKGVVQAKWDAEKRAIAAEQARQKAQQDETARQQAEADDAKTKRLAQQTNDALQEVKGQADGRAALRSVFDRMRRLRGIE